MSEDHYTWTGRDDFFSATCPNSTFGSLEKYEGRTTIDEIQSTRDGWRCHYILKRLRNNENVYSNGFTQGEIIIPI